MAHAPARSRTLLSATVEIPLPSKPRDYRPGDGPALAPLCVSLPDDTGAFIVDKQVLPGKPINGELKLELYYIVGWPDLPAARVAILATKILDYVSPWVLEDWEYGLSLERDEELQKQKAAEERKQKERAKARSALVTGVETATGEGTGAGAHTGTSTPGTPAPKKRRRGRPGRAEVLARNLAQQASFGGEELADVSLPPMSTSGPSLSTPNKKKGLAQVALNMEDLGDLDEIEDTEAADINEAIYRQLRGDSEYGSDDHVPEGEGSEEASGELTRPGSGSGGDFTALDLFLPAPSSRGYAESLVPVLPHSIQPNPTRYVSPVLISLPPSSKTASSSSRMTQLTALVPVPSYLEPTMNKTSVPIEKSVTPIPVPLHPLFKAKPRGLPRVATVTPIPAPPVPVPKPKPLIKPHSPKMTPIPPPPCVQSGSKPVKKPHKITHTPVPPPAPFTLTEPTRSQEQNGFTHISPSLQKQPSGANHRAHIPSKSGTPASKASSSRKQTQHQPQEEQEWEVKRLEDDSVIETGGKLVRYFKVRWVGNWPAGQNPTWEPEDCISPVVVQKYLKDKAAKMAKSGSPSKAIVKQTPSLKRKYSSVAEAFEGDADALPPPNSGGFQVNEAEDEAEEHLQVTEQTRSNTPSQKFRLDPALLRELIASFSP
ncbi:hypothetical protein F5Y14DRAFT_400617 [Nemania sp. NC0429]|nr:hypothetical protein F5Y14DRAFT_400617 [Nemania sp. NC0429]